MIYVLLLVSVIIVIIALSNKRKKEKVIPTEWNALLEGHVRFYQLLNDAEKQLFKDQMLVFLEEVYIDAVHFELEEIDRVFVASSAIIPVFRFRNWHYTNIKSVIIYPDNFNENLGFGSDDEDRWIAGMVGTGKYENQMLLSRKALHHGFKNKTDKLNTGIHEFIHLLDKTDGQIDGVPHNFLGQEYIIPWLNLMHQGMEAINNDQSDLRNYGGTKQAEFFTVASEYFFERPKLLRRKHPELYEMLERCYDPNKG
ncbi:MAG: Mlc titration factor MtfA (ptsG expression regulator) [Crocinitomix sp.]|jgi:Mlc titration factor MtfA (ptsG expression regulator)